MGGEIALMMFETDSGNTCYWLSIIMAFVLILYLINTELYFTFIWLVLLALTPVR